MKRLILALICLITANLVAQELPDAPSHRFWDKKNRILQTYVVAGIALDSHSTQGFIGHYREPNPLARPLVEQGWPGQIVASSLGYGAQLGVSYWFHRKGHHRLERWTPLIVGSIEIGLAVNNYRCCN